MDQLAEIREDRSREPNFNKGKMVLDGVVMLILSIMLYNLGLTSVLFIAPLMLFAARYGKDRGAIFIALSFLVCSLFEAIEFYSSQPFNGYSFLELAMNLYIPMSLSAAGIIWLYTSRWRMVSRFFASLAPSISFVLVFLVIFLADRALFTTLYTKYEDAFAALLEPIFVAFGLELDFSWIFLLFLLTLGSMILPITFTAVCANCFIYETVLHSRESDWEDRIVGIEFPSDMVWAFLIAWGSILLFYFISVPIAVEVVALNIGLLLGVIYAIQGFSVLFSWLRRTMVRLKSMTLFIILFITASVIPGINFIVLLGLPLIGLLESFFDLKKIGVRKDEDYS